MTIKGFGFIESSNGKSDIFIHVSALKRTNRRPVVGDLIRYQLHSDNNGKNRAVNAKIEGIAEIRPSRSNRGKIKNGYPNTWLSKLVTIVVLILIGAIAYKEFFEKNKLFETPTAVISAPLEQTNYSCDGKIYCSEMTSCEEAEFYLNTCPGNKMDGDGDGIPCERQWCNP